MAVDTEKRRRWLRKTPDTRNGRGLGCFLMHGVSPNERQPLGGSRGARGPADRHPHLDASVRQDAPWARKSKREKELELAPGEIRFLPGKGL